MYFWEKLKSAIKGYSNLVVSCSFLKFNFCNTFGLLPKSKVSLYP